MRWIDKLFKYNENGINSLEDEVHYHKIPNFEDENFIKKIKPLCLDKVDFVGSPNKSNRRSTETPSYIVLHHTGPGNFNGIVKWLCNKSAKASAHYVLGTDGQLKQLVNTEKQAWHCGVARWQDLHNNSGSIGIELCNIGRMDKYDDGFYYEVGRSLRKYTGKIQPISGSIQYPNGTILPGYYIPYGDKQINKLVALCKALILKYPEITKTNVITHYQVAQPIGRKNDPFGLDVNNIISRIFDGQD